MSYPYIVSVRLMVYNHELFIREAIEGILNQKTNFLVEVVVGDDFSTDRSLEIIREYQNTSNVHFKILERKIGDIYWEKRQRIGRLYNFINILENCTGKYIALLDGDDYWTDPFKLQKQVGILESNSDIAISFHNIVINYAGNMKKEKLMDLISGDLFSIEDLATASITIPTLSVVFRNKLTDEFLEILKMTPVGDYPLSFLLTRDGSKLHYLNEIMAVYRSHPEGFFTSKIRSERLMILNKTIQIVKPYLDFKIQKLLDLQCNRLFENALIDSVDDVTRFRELYLKYSEKPDNDLIEFLRKEINSRPLINKLEQIKRVIILKCTL